MTSKNTVSVGELTPLVKAILDDIGPASTKIVSPEVSLPLGHIPASYELGEELSLGDAGVTGLEQAVDLCLADPCVQATAMRREVWEVVFAPLVCAHKEGRQARDVAEEIVAHLKAGPTRRTVVLGMSGLRIEGDPIEVAGVRLRPHDSGEVEALGDLPGDMRRRIAWDEALSEFSSLAFTEVQAFPGSECQVAEARVEEVLHYARCYVAAERGDRHGQFGLPASWGRGTLVCFSLDPESGVPVHANAQGRGQMPVVLSSDDITRMRESWGLDGVSKALALPRWEREQDKREMCRRLAAAIHWAGAARQQPLSAYEAAHYATAIDSLVVEKRSSAKKFARGLRLLVGRWCEDRCTCLRKELLSTEVTCLDKLEPWAKSFYTDVRNHVIHEGMLSIGPKWERHLHLWPDLVLMAIAAVADHLDEWQRLKDLQKDLQ